MIDQQSIPINKLLFRCEQYPNLTVNITPSGMDVHVTLNIEPEMRRYLKDNSYKADQLWVYHLHRKVTSLSEVIPTYNTLLTRAMINCREAKRKVLDQEIRQLKLSL